jgi:hypothetical protein
MVWLLGFKGLALALRANVFLLVMFVNVCLLVFV